MSTNRPPVALVVGGSSGIGLAIAQELLASGWLVVTTHRSTPPSLDGARWMRLDIAESCASETVLKALSDFAMPKVDALVHCAGVCEPGAVEWMDAAALEASVRINAVAPVALTAGLLPVLALGSRVIYLGSISGRVTLPLLGAYSASKFALRALCNAQHLELKGRGIYVTYVECGNVKTRIWDRGEVALAQRHVGAGAPREFDRTVAASRLLSRHAVRFAMPLQRVAREVSNTLTWRGMPPRLLRIGSDARLWSAFDRMLPERLQVALLTSLFRL